MTEDELRKEILLRQRRGREGRYKGANLKRFNAEFVDLTEKRFREHKRLQELEHEKETNRIIEEEMKGVLRKRGLR